MHGPRPRGFWIEPPGQDYRSLEAGRRYRVITAFRDFDRGEHRIGEEWVFLGHSWLPHDDGLSLFVSLDGEQQWHIRLRDRPEEQRAIVDHLDRFVQPV